MKFYVIQCEWKKRWIFSECNNFEFFWVLFIQHIFFFLWGNFLLLREEFGISTLFFFVLHSSTFFLFLLFCSVFFSFFLRIAQNFDRRVEKFFAWIFWLFWCEKDLLFCSILFFCVKRSSAKQCRMFHFLLRKRHVAKRTKKNSFEVFEEREKEKKLKPSFFLFLIKLKGFLFYGMLFGKCYVFHVLWICNVLKIS